VRIFRAFFTCSALLFMRLLRFVAAAALHAQTPRSGLVPPECFLVTIPATSQRHQSQCALFFGNDARWICSRPEFNPGDKMRTLAKAVERVQNRHETGSSALIELCDFNLLLYAATTGIVPLEEVLALTKALTAATGNFDEDVVQALLFSEAWSTLVAVSH